MNHYLVVGAGFSGTTVARELAEAGHKVTIIDERNHIAGNAYEEYHYLSHINSWIKYHKYGPHLFHTKNKEVWDYLSKFTEWTPYKHKVKALLKDGRYVTLPVNKETKEIVGEDNILDIFYKPYTKKMWGIELEQLDPSVRNRVAIRDDMNEYYFPDDTYQALPKYGYNFLIQNMLNHPLITVKLNTRFSRDMERDYDHIFTSQSIDSFFNYCEGTLQYVGMYFTHKLIDLNRVLPATTVNFTHDLEYTRVTEWKNLPDHSQDADHVTLLTYETPTHGPLSQRYYPVKDPDGRNAALYKTYKDKADELYKNITFIGRCGNYVYIDMDQAVNMGLQIVKNFTKKKKWID